MAKVRVYELARELDMESKVLVNKLLAGGLNIKNYMSTLDEEAVARARDIVAGVVSEVVEEKRIKPTVIRRRKKTVKINPNRGGIPISRDRLSECQSAVCCQIGDPGKGSSRRRIGKQNRRTFASLRRCYSRFTMGGETWTGFFIEYSVITYLTGNVIVCVEERQRLSRVQVPPHKPKPESSRFGSISWVPL